MSVTESERVQEVDKRMGTSGRKKEEQERDVSHDWSFDILFTLVHSITMIFPLFSFRVFD